MLYLLIFAQMLYSRLSEEYKDKNFKNIRIFFKNTF